jgi:hypothetical protein
MSNQIIGYYKERKETLLKEFGHTLRLIEDFLVKRYGNDFADRLKLAVHQEYEKLIPEIPFINGFRGKPLNQFLIITAQELATYLAMKKSEKSAREAWELCHEALRLKLAEIPKWKKWLMKFLFFSPPVRMIFKMRARKNEKARLGGFEIEYLVDHGSDFDFGVNYLQCGNLKFANEHGGEEFAPYICMSDIALSDSLGWGLIRTKTLADGCGHCDFRFKKDAATQITSQSPEVQETIDIIQKD